MQTKIFISYSHTQAQWVWERLVPCLKAAGANVLIDRERFEVGKRLIGQMDAVQDRAHTTILVFSPEYMDSPSCQHEMRKALDRDPLFEKGTIIPLLRVRCSLPVEITNHDPLHVNLIDDRDPNAWDQLLQACRADLGTAAPAWLQARDNIVRSLRRGESVNWVVKGRVKWRELLMDIKENHLPNLAIVDLDSGLTISRQRLVIEILKACGLTQAVSPKAKGEDLAIMQRFLESKKSVTLLSLLHLDNILHRNYGPELFHCFRNLVIDKRKLLLLLGSRMPFSELLADRRFQSSIDPLSSLSFQTIELESEKS